MAVPAASQRGRIAALLKKLPSQTAFRLVEAVGLFVPVAALIDHPPPEAPQHDGENGRVSSQSLPQIWRWLSESVAPDAAGRILEAFTRSAMGRAPPDDALALPKLRAELGREAMRAFEHHSFNEITEALGSRRAAHDALLLAQALAISEQIEALRVLLPLGDGPLQPSLIKVARDIAEREPECKAALACIVIGQIGRAADAVPLLIALVRRRDEHRLDRSDIAIALSAAIEATAARGASDFHPGRPPAAVLAAAQARARDVVDLASALRGHVTDDWMRRLNARLDETSKPLEAACAEHAALLCAALSCPEAGMAEDAEETAIGAAAFLTGAKTIAPTLRFEVARERAVGAAIHVLESDAGSAEDRLRELAERAPGAAARYVELRARLIELLEDGRTARAWLRRGRRIIGRPTFSEHVLSPIEPLIVEDDGVEREGCVAGDIVDAFWRWASAGPLADQRRAAETAFEAERDRDPHAASAIVAEFRPALAGAARSLRDAGGAGFDAKAQAQLAVVAAMLECEPVIRAHLEAWPPRVKHVGEQHIAAVRALHDELTATRPEIEPALLILVMSRLERPWHILRMLERIARTNSDILVEATEFVSLGEILIDRAAADAAGFKEPPADEPFNADLVLARLERFAGIASGMTEEFQIRRNGRWGSRFYALKSQAGRDLEELCRAAVTAVEAVTPKQPAGGLSAADVTKALDEATVAAAAQYARFLRGSKVLDQRAAFAGPRSAAMARIDARLTNQIEALLALAHGGERREEALAHLRALAEVVGEFEGVEARDILLRRAAAA